MGSFADYVENKVLDHITGKTSFTMPTAYLAASTADPTDDGSGLAEPSGGSYARLETAGSDWAAASGGATSNAAILAFAEATGSWGTITHVALFDAASGGNMLAHAALDSSQSISSGEVLRFPIGDLDITLD